MGSIPVIAHHRAEPAPDQLDDVERLAAALKRERPELGVWPEFRPLIPEALGGEPALHLDDLSEIPMLERDGSALSLQARARLRARRATSWPAVPRRWPDSRPMPGTSSAWARFAWLTVPPRSNPVRLALACWEDRATRRRLVHEFRRGRLTYLHPHMGTSSAWALAALLHRASRRPVKVIAPPPGVARWANDKTAFAEAVTRLFGPAWRPRTEAAGNYAALAHRVATLARDAEVLGFKLPDSAGGRGNVVLDAAPFRRMPLRAIRHELEERLRPLHWAGRQRLLVGRWETDVLCAPSVQLWIPPIGQGPPVVEGLFQQALDSRAGIFRGCIRAGLPETPSRALVTRSWLLAALFQRLGYVGRCSFDLLLAGASLATARAEFLECNGRWGGTSGPMTLMNRLFGDWAARPYATMECQLPGLDRLRFVDVLGDLGPDLYDRRTGRGWLIIYNPGPLTLGSGLQYLALGPTWEEAARRATVEVPERLQRLVAERGSIPVGPS